MNNTLHRIHLWADVGIGSIALLGLFAGEFFNLFMQADLVFHITIFVLAFGGIAAEKIIHKCRHKGVILH